MNNNTALEEKISFFIELGKPLSRATTIKETLRAVMYQVGKIFQPVNWSLLLKDSKNDNLIFSIVVGKNKEKLQGRKLPKGEGIAGHIFNTGQPLIVNDVGKDKRFSQRVDNYTGFKTNSIIGVPLKTNKTIFGVIELVNKIGGEKFTDVELKILSSIAEYAAIAIERSYSYQSLQKMALSDSLTGLSNKNHFEHMLSNRADLFNAGDGHSFLMFIDINQFRTICELHGPNAGDQTLINLSKILKKSVKKEEAVFRYKDDKFIILSTHTTTEDVEKIKKRIINNHFEYLDSATDTTTFQINIECHPFDETSPKDLIERVRNKIHNSTDTVYHLYNNPMEDNLQMMLEEENIPQAGEEKKIHGKKVSLPGTFAHHGKNIHGHLTVKLISGKGVSFEIKTDSRIQREDLINIVFTLDDQKRSVIKRQVIVHAIDNRHYEATFYNPPPYDKDLGFYLI